MDETAAKEADEVADNAAIKPTVRPSCVPTAGGGAKWSTPNAAAASAPTRLRVSR